jgi:CspA family cold shock protein
VSVVKNRYEDEEYEANMSDRVRGTVKWFNEDKGYGFIARDDGGDDVFLHYSALDQDGFKTVDEDAELEFEVEEGPKGPKAVDVREL